MKRRKPKDAMSGYRYKRQRNRDTDPTEQSFHVVGYNEYNLT